MLIQVIVLSLVVFVTHKNVKYCRCEVVADSSLTLIQPQNTIWQANGQIDINPLSPTAPVLGPMIKSFDGFKI